MFLNTVQPPLVSLFSSTGSDPLQLFEKRSDPSLSADSFIHLLHDRTSLPRPPAPASLIAAPPLTDQHTGGGGAGEPDSNSEASAGHALEQTVLHIQSPTLRTTYVQCPPQPPATGTGGARRRSFRRAGAGFARPPLLTAATRRDELSSDLGLRHPWMHVQVRNMGREWALEVGVVDTSGRMGIVRLSTFQKRPRLKLPAKHDTPPLLHLPLSFPPASSRPLTAWCTLALCLPSYISHFSSPSLASRQDNGPDHARGEEDGEGEGENEEDEHRSRNALASSVVPSGAYSHLAYVRVYATCRLRRIWFSEAGPSQTVPWEFELYGR